MSEEAKQQAVKISGDIKQQVEQTVDTLCTRVSNIIQHGINNLETKIIQSKTQQSETMVERATDAAAQEIYKTSDTAVRTVTDQIQYTLNQAMSTPINTTQTKTNNAPQFPLAHQWVNSTQIDNSTKGDKPPIQYEETTQHIEHKEEVSDDDWGRFGPEPDQHYTRTSTQTRRKLPELNLFKMVQQVRIPYTGRESSFAWYFKLRTAVQQYGVLLKPVDQLHRNKYLCPKTYYGERITQDRYWDMSIALYQLLSHPDTVTEDNDTRHRYMPCGNRRRIQLPIRDNGAYTPRFEQER
jgi:hypothetical protein